MPSLAVRLLNTTYLVPTLERGNEIKDFFALPPLIIQ